MSQVPFPTSISESVPLLPRSRALFVGRWVLALTIVAVIGAIAREGWQAGWFDRFRQSEQPERGGTIAGASVQSPDRLIDELDVFVVQPQDLPAPLSAYAVRLEDSGAVEGVLVGDESETSYRAVFEGPQPLDVFTSAVFLFKTPQQAAQAYYGSSTPAGLALAVGQPAEVTSDLDRGQDGVIFREAAAADATRVFGGVLYLSDRVVHLVFGWFPANLSDANFAQLISGSLNRQARVVPGLPKRPDRDDDADGLPNDVEATLGTEPRNRDSDGDGFMDQQELEAGYDPLGPGKPSSLENLFVVPGLST